MKLANIQALRGVAALLVVSDHVPRLESRLFTHGLLSGAHSAGAIGVDLFFVISGFIMVTTTWDAFGRAGTSSAFLMRRALRILPFYWLTLTCYVGLALAAPRYFHLPVGDIRSLVLSYALIPHGESPVLSVAWSLQFEAYFYLVFAIAMLLPRRLFPAVLGVWGAVLLALAATLSNTSPVLARFLGSPLTLEFMMGCAVGALIMGPRLGAPWLWCGIGTVGLLLACAVGTYYPDGYPTVNDSWIRTILTIPIAALVYGVVILEQRTQLVAHRVLVVLGDASYTMYLWHILILGAWFAVAARFHLTGPLGDVFFVSSCFVVAGGTAIPLYFAVERRMMKAFSRLGRSAPDRAVITS